MRVRDENKEQAIRQKALEMVVKEGFDGLSMQKLARAAGVSPATIYIYFKDRDDLLLQICEEEGDKMAEATLKNFDPAMPFDEGLKIQWMNRAQYCLENPLSMHFLEQIKYSPYNAHAFRNMRETFQRVMGNFLHNAIQRQQLVKLPLEVYWSVAFAPLYQLVKFHMSPNSMPSTGNFVLDDKVLNLTLSLVLKALKP